MLLHFRNDLHVVPNITVSHEANDAHVILVVGRLERRLNRRHHLGAASAGTRLQKRLRLAEIGSCCRHRLWKENLRVARKRDQIERVRRIEIVESEPHRLLRFLDWKSFHRARSIEYEDQLFRRYVVDRNALGWLKNQREETSVVALMSEQCVLNRLARDVVAKNEVLVGN